MANATVMEPQTFLSLVRIIDDSKEKTELTSLQAKKVLRETRVCKRTNVKLQFTAKRIGRVCNKAAVSKFLYYMAIRNSFTFGKSNTVYI